MEVVLWSLWIRRSVYAVYFQSANTYLIMKTIDQLRAKPINLALIAIAGSLLVLVTVPNPAMSALLGSYHVVEDSGTSQSSDRDILDFDDTSTINFAVSDESINATTGKTNIAANLISGSVTSSHIQDSTIADADLSSTIDFRVVPAMRISLQFDQDQYWSWNNGFNGDNESDVDVDMPYACTLKNLKVQVFTNDLNSTATVTVRLNGADTSMSIPITSTSTGTYTDSDTVTCSQNDLVSIFVDPNGTSGNIDWAWQYEVILKP